MKIRNNPGSGHPIGFRVESQPGSGTGLEFLTRDSDLTRKWRDSRVMGMTRILSRTTTTMTNARRLSASDHYQLATTKYMENPRTTNVIGSTNRLSDRYRQLVNSTAGPETL